MNRTQPPGLSPILLALLVYASQAQADCIDNADGTFTCSGTAQNLDPQTGLTTLDNASGDVTLTNDNIIANDNTTASVGKVYTIDANGGSNVEIINNGEIYVDRSSVVLDPALNNADPVTGELRNGSDLVGVAAAIHSDAATPLLTVTNNGSIFAGDWNFNGPSAYSAAIFGSASQQVINNNGSIFNNWFSYGSDTLAEGQWAIANFGDGLSTLNNIGEVYGDIIMADRNPLLTAAQLTADQLGQPLPLAYEPGNVGIRNSVINNAGYIGGNIYLGSGTHIINNQFVADTVVGTIAGNIYVDQRDAVITDAAGNPVSTVAGNREFTFNNAGDFQGNITINDVAGAVNNITFESGLSDSSGFISPGQINSTITAQGLGDTTVNLNCNYLVSSDDICLGSAAISGVTTINMLGSQWRIGSDENFPVVYQATGDINLSAANVILAPGSIFSAANVVIGGNTLLQGHERVPPASASGALEYGFGNIDANLISNGAIDLRTATLNVSGDASFNGGSKLFTTITGDGFGKVVIGGTGTMDDNATIIPNVGNGLFIHNGQSFTIANNTTGTPLVQNGSGIVQFFTNNSNGDLQLVADVAVPTTIAAGMSKAGANALNALFNYTGTDPDLVQLGAEIQSLSGEELGKNGERLRPEINDGAIRTVLTHTDRVLGIVESHLFDIYLAGIRGEKTQPIVDQTPGLGAGIWVQGFGNSGTQDARRNTDGYSVSSSGFAFGADRLVGGDGDVRVGAAFSYANGNVANEGVTDANHIDINSYMGTLYAAWGMKQWYMNGAVGIGRNTYDSSRSALGRRVSGNHDSWQFTSRLDAGWPLQLSENLTFVPIASLSYNYLDESGYKEKGKYPHAYFDQPSGMYVPIESDPAIALEIQDRKIHSLRSGLGGKILLSLQEEDWNAGIELRGFYSHEFGDIAQDSTARFIAGGPTFRSPGIKPARDGIVLGSSVRLTGNEENNQLSLLVSYDADLRDEYVGQALTMMLRYDFGQGPSYLRRAATMKMATDNKPVNTKSIKVTDGEIASLQAAMTAPAPASSDPAYIKKEQAINAAIDGWISALANKNLDRYFNSYAADFQSPDGGTRQQWERKRRTELARNANPAINISYLTIKPNGNQASAVFTQTLTESGGKQVMLKRVDFMEKNGRWLIVKENGMTVAE